MRVIKFKQLNEGAVPKIAEITFERTKLAFFLRKRTTRTYHCISGFWYDDITEELISKDQNIALRKYFQKQRISQQLEDSRKALKSSRR